MVLKSDQQRVKDLLTETITLLCKNGLEYNRVFSIDALIGITLDEDDVFLVSIRDTITNETSRHDSESSFVRSRKSVPMKRVSSSPMQNKKKRLRPSSPDVSNLPLKLYKAADIQNQVDQYENKQNSDNNLALSNDYVTLADDENGEHSEHTEENSQSNDVSSNKSPVQAASADIDSGQNMIGKIKQEVEDPEELRILKTETNDQLFADSFGDQAGCSWQSPTGVSNLSGSGKGAKYSWRVDSGKNLSLFGNQQRRSFTTEFKLQVIQHTMSTGNKLKTAREFGIDAKQVRNWMKNPELLAMVPPGVENKVMPKMLYHGRPSSGNAGTSDQNAIVINPESPSDAIGKSSKTIQIAPASLSLLPHLDRENVLTHAKQIAESKLHSSTKKKILSKLLPKGHENTVTVQDGLYLPFVVPFSTTAIPTSAVTPIVLNETTGPVFPAPIEVTTNGDTSQADLPVFPCAVPVEDTDSAAGVNSLPIFPTPVAVTESTTCVDSLPIFPTPVAVTLGGEVTSVDGGDLAEVNTQLNGDVVLIEPSKE